MNSKFLIVPCSVLALLTTCKKDYPEAFAKFADQACACKDAACGGAVLQQFTKFVSGLKRSTHLTTDQSKEITASGVRMGQCVITSGVDAAEVDRFFAQSSSWGR